MNTDYIRLLIDGFNAWVYKTKWKDAFVSGNWKFQKNLSNEYQQKLKDYFNADNMLRIANKMQNVPPHKLKKELKKEFQTVFASFENEKDAQKDSDKLIANILDNIIEINNKDISFQIWLSEWRDDFFRMSTKIEELIYEKESDYKVNIRPYFDIQCSSMLKRKQDDSFLGYIRLFIENSESSIEKKTGQSTLLLKNVGLGTAVNIWFDIKVQCDSAKHQEWFTNSNSLVDSSTVMPGKCGEVLIQLYNKTNEVDENDCQWNDNLKMYTYQKAISKIPKGFSFSVIMTYQDLLFNSYSQVLEFKVVYVLEDKVINGNIFLQQVHYPIRID